MSHAGRVGTPAWNVLHPGAKHLETLFQALLSHLTATLFDMIGIVKVSRQRARWFQTKLLDMQRGWVKETMSCS